MDVQVAGPRNRGMTILLLVASQPMILGASPDPHTSLPAYRSGVDGKLALSIPKAVLNEGKVARVSISSSDCQDNCAHRHILKDSFLRPSGQGEKEWANISPGVYGPALGTH